MSSDALEEWEAKFSKLTIEDLIVHLTSAFPDSIHEITALYGRFIEIAFTDATESNHVRALSASWAKAIESVVEIRFGFGEHEIWFNAFEAYRSHCKTIALEHGYGTAMYTARHEPNGLFRRLFDGVAQGRDVTSRATFLASIAFGRESDI